MDERVPDAPDNTPKDDPTRYELLDLDEAGIERLLTLVCDGDIYRFWRAQAIRLVLTRWPEVPDDVLKRIKAVPGRDGADVSVNVGMVVGAWLKKQAKADDAP